MYKIIGLTLEACLNGFEEVENSHAADWHWSRIERPPVTKFVIGCIKLRIIQRTYPAIAERIT